MELKDLKSDWQNTNVSFKSETDLFKMTKIKNHPTLKKIRERLIIETICFVLLLAVYYDWFDGDKKPMYTNALLTISLLLIIVNNVIGYLSIVKKINGIDLRSSLQKYLLKIKQLAAFSLICTLLYSISFLVFFSSVIHFTREKSFILLGAVILLFQLIFWSQRIWNKRIKSLQLQLNDFER